jgi:hypothetical protein
MFEVAHAGEDHGHAPLIRGGDDFFIADGTTGLNGSGSAGLGGGNQAIGERE